jgi:hypothetical protein
VDYSGGFSTINAQRFGQKFVGKVRWCSFNPVSGIWISQHYPLF